MTYPIRLRGVPRAAPRQHHDERAVITRQHRNILSAKIGGGKVLVILPSRVAGNLLSRASQTKETPNISLNLILGGIIDRRYQLWCRRSTRPWIGKMITTLIEKGKDMADM